MRKILALGVLSFVLLTGIVIAQDFYEYGDHVEDFTLFTSTGDPLTYYDYSDWITVITMWDEG